MPDSTLHYSTIVRWSEDDGEFVATIPELPGISGVAPTTEQAVAEAHAAAAAALEVLAEDGFAAPKPTVLTAYSGQLRLRMPRSLHARLAELAQLEGVSLNTVLVSLLADGAARRFPPPVPTELTVLDGGKTVQVKGGSA